ncbi:hypothetical protein H0H93_000952 [Arthromyces matolae]|nr:hypothetical protein H0H93_000952 [Arthromyces matolae]
MNDTILVPLSQLDQCYLEDFSFSIGFVLQNLDIDALRAAALRVIDKWRLLAGHLEWSKNLSTWGVRVPLHGDVSSRLKFTVNKLQTRLPPSFVVNENTSAHVFTRPPIKYFRHESVPDKVQSYASSKAPIWSIHVTEFSNCVCLGFTLSHAVFDALGGGITGYALHHELQGKPWAVPPLSESNILREVLHDLETAPRMYDDIHKETETYSALRGALVPASTPNTLALVAGTAYEKTWHNVETKVVYLGPKAIEKLRKEVNDGATPVPNVSTSDILTAWILKAIYANEGGDSPISLLSNVSIRRLLIKKYPALKQYPHNAIAVHPITPFTKQDLAVKSLAELAILHHRAHEPATEVAWVQAYNTHLSKALHGHLTYAIGRDSWPYSNQAQSGINDVAFGSKKYSMFFWLTPFEAGRWITISKFKDGYIVQANARSKRWRAVAKAVEDLNKLEARL